MSDWEKRLWLVLFLAALAYIGWQLTAVVGELTSIDFSIGGVGSEIMRAGRS